MAGGWWRVVGGGWQVAGGGWQVAGGRWRVAGGGWQVAGGGWRVAGGRWQVAGGRWRVAGGGWRVAGGGWRVAGGRWWVAGGGGQNNDVGLYHSLNCIFSSATETKSHDDSLPLCHDNRILRFCRNARQLDLGESRSPTQIFKRNLLHASHGLWAYVCAFRPGLMVTMAMVMMAMVMMAMVMVSVMVIIVPEALRQVDWLRQSFYRLSAFY